MPNDNPLRRIRLCGAFAAMTLVALARPVHAAEPGDGLEVHDVSLWVIDPGAKMANARTAYPSALPVTVNSLRSGHGSRALRRVAPIGLLTFHGPAAVDLDVDLRTNSGSFLAHWPPGDSLPNRLHWSGTPAYNLVEKLADESELVFVDSDSWFNKAREGDALYVKRGARSERFLAYDVELKLDAPVRLEGGPDKYRLINTSNRALYDVLIARHTPQGVRLAWVDVLPPNESSAPAAAPKEDAPKPKEGKKPDLNLFSPTNALPAATPATARKKLLVALTDHMEAAAGAKLQVRKLTIAPAARLGQLMEVQLVPILADAQTGGTKQTAGAAKDKPATGLFGGLRAAKPSLGVEITLSEPLAVDSPEAAAKTTKALSQRLSKAGLTQHEVELFVDHYGSLFFESRALVVACRLDPAAIDEKIPLSVFPAPAGTVRVAMVLVRNADPQLGVEVDKLIVQLGDPKFAVREAAQQRLMELGPLAFPALNKALSHADLEIVIRAERTLLNQKQTLKASAPPRAPAAGRLRIRAAPVIINR